MRKSSLLAYAAILAVILLAGCQITIDPVVDDYFGFRATFTLSPNVLPEPAHELPEELDLPAE